MHSYIVRVYRRRSGRVFSGTVEAVDAGRSAGGQPLQAPRSFASAADLLPILFRPNLDLHQTTFAMGEAVAHLHALWQRGDLVRKRGADGVWRFSPSA